MFISYIDSVLVLKLEHQQHRLLLLVPGYLGVGTSTHKHHRKDRPAFAIVMIGP